MTSATAWRHQQRWPPEAGSVRGSRRAVSEQLVTHDLAGMVDDVALVLSELATNAVRHAGTGFDVLLEVRDGELVLEVSDTCADPPVLQGHRVDSEGGRGLQLVEALSDRWGVAHPAGGGNSVWACFGLRL